MQEPAQPLSPSAQSGWHMRRKHGTQPCRFQALASSAARLLSVVDAVDHAVAAQVVPGQAVGVHLLAQQARMPSHLPHAQRRTSGNYIWLGCKMLRHGTACVWLQQRSPLIEHSLKASTA